MASGSSTYDRVSTSPAGEDAENASPWPESILLAQQAYVVASRNDTTAAAKSRANHTVEITFWIADPPAVSFYTCHCSQGAANLKVPPQVVAAHGRFVLLRALFASGAYEEEYDYFMYTGDPESPSLESVPIPADDDKLIYGHGVNEFGIVPLGDDDGCHYHYLLVTLRERDFAALKGDYRLHIYSSVDRTWRTRELINPCPGEHTIMPDKVITLPDGVLAWVSFLDGMLLCNVLKQQEPLHGRYIPLPAPMLGNREGILETFVGGASARCFRDVACVNDTIKFVEMEHREIVTEISDGDAPLEEPPLDPRDRNVLHDSYLIMLSKRKRVENKTRIVRTMDGWSAMTWTRDLWSDYWRKGSIVDVDDIPVDDAASSALMSAKRHDESAGSLAFRNLYSGWPTLSIDGNGNDLVYLKSSRQRSDSDRWVVAVDLAKKTLKVEAPGAHPFGKYLPLQQIFCPCALSNYLKMTPDIKVLAIQIAQTGSSANQPNNRPICAGEPNSNESKNKRPRLSPTEKISHAEDGAQSNVHDVFSSQAYPCQNKMPPLQLCFNRWAEPDYGGYSSWSWPHQNSLNVPLQPPPPPPQMPHFVNGWAGPCYNPIYASSAPSPDMHSCNNYQPPWQQPLVPEQQTAPSRSFGPHQAPHGSFNNWWRGSYHVNSLQRPTSNSYHPYSYGAHPGSDNYDQR